MHKVYGNKGNPNPIPETYDQDTELVINRNGNTDPIAWGKWTSRGFILKRGSLVLFGGNDEVYIKEIKEELISDGLLIFNKDDNDYELTSDIFLWSPSTAGRIVQGHNSNGYIDWKNLSGEQLQELLYPSK